MVANNTGANAPQAGNRQQRRAPAATRRAVLGSFDHTIHLVVSTGSHQPAPAAAAAAATPPAAPAVAPVATAPAAPQPAAVAPAPAPQPAVQAQPLEPHHRFWFGVMLFVAALVAVWIYYHPAGSSGTTPPLITTPAPGQGANPAVGTCTVPGTVWVQAVGGCVLHVTDAKEINKATPADTGNDLACKGKPAGFRYDTTVTGPDGTSGIAHHVCGKRPTT